MTEDAGKTEEKLPAERPKIETGLAVTGGLIPKDFDSLYRFCTILAASGLMPRGLEKVEAVFVAVQMGMEVGLSPMQAVQNIAPINGRPAIWGDAVLGLVRASGLLAEFAEIYEGDYPDDTFMAVCTGKRKGENEVIRRAFSIADAKQAGLWCQDRPTEKQKFGPWYKYPKRMLQMRARSWALRDGFGDVLKGLRMAEEVQDYDIDLVRHGGTYSADTDTAADLTEKIKESVVEEKTGKPTTAINCPYCKHNIRTAIIAMLESGVETFTCPACKKDGKIEAGQPVGIYPVGQTARNSEPGFSRNEDYSAWTDQDWIDFRSEWFRLQQPGFSTYFYKNRAAFEAAPDKLQAEAKAKWDKFYPETPWPLGFAKVDESPESVVELPNDESGDNDPDYLLDEIAKFPTNTRTAASAALGIDSLGRAMNTAELKTLLYKCQEMTKPVSKDSESQKVDMINAIESEKDPAAILQALGFYQYPALESCTLEQLGVVYDHLLGA